ncbi:MAG: hypothetical protein ABIG28_02485 [archaeon]
MVDDGAQIVDEYDKLQRVKKEIEMRLAELRSKLIGFSVDSEKEIVFGTSKVCSVRGYDKVVYPADKMPLTEMIKQKGLYEQLSSVNYFKLSPRILNGEIDQEIISLTKKKRDFRISFRNKQELVVG